MFNIYGWKFQVNPHKYGKVNLFYPQFSHLKIISLNNINHKYVVYIQILYDIKNEFI